MANDSSEMNKSGNHERRENSKEAFETQHLGRTAVCKLKESIRVIL